jgi:hypothetical protein
MNGGLPPPVVAPQVRSRAAMDAQQKRSDVENGIIASLRLGRSNDASASSRTTKTGAQKIDSIYDLIWRMGLTCWDYTSEASTHFLLRLKNNPSRIISSCCVKISCWWRRHWMNKLNSSRRQPTVRKSWSKPRVLILGEHGSAPRIWGTLSNRIWTIQEIMGACWEGLW